MPRTSPPSSQLSPSLSQGTLTSATDGGIAGEHPSLPTRELLVGPTTQSEFNTVKAGLIPFACWGVNDLRFQFGSSFVTPGIQEELQTLNELIHKHTVGALKPPLSIFGHADPVGQDAFNKGLSGRRAQAIYGLLTRNTELWEELFTQPQGEDRWGDPEIDNMLATVASFPENASSPESETPSQDTPAPVSRTERIEAFQAEHGLVVDGVVGPNTRKELFRAYMDTLCGDLVVDPSEFLGKGKDLKGKADYQGCSEFNPLLIFSQEKHEKFQQAQDKTERNAENASNRRVMVFLFRPGTEVTPAKWPCPRVSEGTNDCTKRFWSDGEERRTRREPDTRREFGESQDTFACRFYDRLSNKSPCEHFGIFTGAHISVLLRSNSGAVPLANQPYKVRINPKNVLEGKTDEDGLIAHRNIPPGNYPIELDGKTMDTLVPTLPLHLERCIIRMPDFFLFEPINSRLPLEDDPEEVLVADLDDHDPTWEVV